MSKKEIIKYDDCKTIEDYVGNFWSFDDSKKRYLLINKKLPSKFLTNIFNKLNIDEKRLILYNQNIPYKFLIKNFYKFSMETRLSILKYAKMSNKWLCCNFNKLSKDEVKMCIEYQSLPFKLIKDNFYNFDCNFDSAYIVSQKIPNMFIVKNFYLFSDVAREECIRFKRFSYTWIRNNFNKITSYYERYNFIKYQNIPIDYICKIFDGLDRVEKNYCLIYQKLSEYFIIKNFEHLDGYQKDLCLIHQNFDISKLSLTNEQILLYNKSHQKFSYKQKINQMKRYAEKYNLKFVNDTLYAYREHDKNGNGKFSKNIVYKVGRYYRDWHVDMRKSDKNSFGLGIYPKGNTLVSVHVDDWGLVVDDFDGKCRVWGFTVLDANN